MLVFFLSHNFAIANTDCKLFSNKEGLNVVNETVENGKCNLIPGEAGWTLWDNEGNEYHVIDKQQTEVNKTKITDEWCLIWYRKSNIGENHISGESYNEYGEESNLVPSKIIFTFKSRNNKFC